MASKREEAKARSNIKSSKMNGTIYQCVRCFRNMYYHDLNRSRFIIPDDSAVPGMNRCPRCCTNISAKSNFRILGKVEDGVVKYYTDNNKKKLVPLKDANKKLIEKHQLKILNAETKKAYF